MFSSYTYHENVPVLNFYLAMSLERVIIVILKQVINYNSEINDKQTYILVILYHIITIYSRFKITVLWQVLKVDFISMQQLSHFSTFLTVYWIDTHRSRHNVLYQLLYLPSTPLLLNKGNRQLHETMASECTHQRFVQTLVDGFNFPFSSYLFTTFT